MLRRTGNIQLNKQSQRHPQKKDVFFICSLSKKEDIAQTICLYSKAHLLKTKTHTKLGIKKLQNIDKPRLYSNFHESFKGNGRESLWPHVPRKKKKNTKRVR